MSRARLVGLVLAFGCSRPQQELVSGDASVQPSVASSAAPVVAPPPLASADLSEAWNPRGIDWKSYDEGLVLAAREEKPICLILFGTWCAHCRNYSHIFADPDLVRRARDFVMVKVDVDTNAAVSKKYSPDGTYVPRTFFLDASGNIIPAGHSDHPRYAHFFDEMHADSLLEAMDAVRPPGPR
jgi:thiol-disulfide isomerase/thioredoxin